MVVVLMIAEKPSLARSLAEILSRKQCKRRKSACSACDVYEYDGVFPPGSGAPAKIKMTSVCGHVMSLDFQPQYNRWDQIDPVGATHHHSTTNTHCMIVCMWFTCGCMCAGRPLWGRDNEEGVNSKPQDM